MQPLVEEKKRVSFNDTLNTVQQVENLRLSLDTPSQHGKLWYAPAEFHKFYEEECTYQQKRAAALAYQRACRPRRCSRRLLQDSDYIPKSPTTKELFEQKTRAIRELQEVASKQYSNFLARNQEKDHAPVEKITRSTTEALAATRLQPARHQKNRQRNQRPSSRRHQSPQRNRLPPKRRQPSPQRSRRQTRQAEMERVRAAFFSG